MATAACSFLFLAAVLVSARSLATADESWAYVEVRPDAHMFWWLYSCTSCAQSFENAPLVMWLQVGTCTWAMGWVRSYFPANY